MPDRSKILTHLDAVISSYDAYTEWGIIKDLPYDRVEELYTLMGHALEVLAPPDTHFRARTTHILDSDWDLNIKIASMSGVLRALRTAYAGDFLSSVTELIHADLFDDFLEMAEYLQAESYKDPAAMLAGGVLEEHLRKLCQKHAIPVVVSLTSGDAPKRAGTMNDELAKAEAYTKLDQKSVMAWLDLRNNTAHGKYDKYDARHVEDLIRGVRNFVARHPA